MNPIQINLKDQIKGDRFKSQDSKSKLIWRSGISDEITLS